MTARSTQPVRFSPEEYLRLEYDAVEKHEFFDGEILAMSGGTEFHSLITANLIREVGNRLKGKPCRAYDSNLRVHIPRTPTYVYPDLSIFCGEARFDPRDRNHTTIVNPRVVIEVLSPSTEGYDRGRKFRRYLRLDALEEHVLVSQDTPNTETFQRREDGTWLLTPAAGLGATLRLRSLNVEIPRAEIYAGVSFPPDPDAPVDGDDDAS